MSQFLCRQSRFYEPEPQLQLAFLVSYLLPSTPGPSPRPSRLLVIPKHDTHSLTLSPTLFLTNSHPLGLPTCPLPLLYLVSGFSSRLGAKGRKVSYFCRGAHPQPRVWPRGALGKG